MSFKKTHWETGLFQLPGKQLNLIIKLHYSLQLDSDPAPRGVLQFVENKATLKTGSHKQGTHKQVLLVKENRM